MQNNSGNKRIQFWVGVAVSVVCLAAVFVFIEPAEIWEAIKNTDYKLWSLAILALIAFLMLRAVRWRFMLSVGFKDQNPISYGNVFHIQNIGYMLTNILPFRLGDVARAVLIGNIPPITISLGLSTMVVERVFDLLFFVILFPFTLAAVGELPSEIEFAFRLTGVLALVVVLALIGAANKRDFALRIATTILNRIPFLNNEIWLRRLDDLLRGLEVLTHPKDGILLVLLSIMVWIPIILGYFLGLRAVNLDPTFIEAAFVVCISAFSVTAPSSPGQVGVFEASVAFAVAGLLGMPDGKAASFAFLYHGVNYVVIGALGVIGISRTGETFGSVMASTKALVKPRSK